MPKKSIGNKNFENFVHDIDGGEGSIQGGGGSIAPPL